MNCYDECKIKKRSCEVKDCRLWIDFPEDLNCTLHAVKNNHTGELTLREVADRIGLSFVRIKQIQDQAVKKVEKLLNKDKAY